MDNSMVLGLVPAFVFSQYLVLEAKSTRQRQRVGCAVLVGMEPTIPSVGGCPALVLNPN